MAAARLADSQLRILGQMISTPHRLSPFFPPPLHPFFVMTPPPLPGFPVPRPSASGNCGLQGGRGAVWLQRISALP